MSRLSRIADLGVNAGRTSPADDHFASEPDPMPANAGSIYWTAEQVADYYQLPVRWVYARCRIKGPNRLPHLRLGKYIRINVSSSQFKEWLARHEVDSATTDR
jgi:hypothetical protein